MKRLRARKLFAVCLALAMVISGFSVPGYASAAKKVTLKLKKSNVSVEKGKKITLKITKKNVKKIKSQKWTTNKKKVATVNKKKGVVSGKKVGTATISCKVKYVAKGSSKTKTKTLKCKVKVVDAKKTITATTEPTAASNAKATAAPAANATATPAANATTTPPPSASPTPDAKPTVEPISLVIPEMDLSDPSVDAAIPDTVTDADVDEDSTNIGESHVSTNGVKKVTDNGMMRRKLTNTQLIQFMGQGWNLANTLESCGVAGTTVAEFEKGWGNVQTTQKIIDGIKASGFDTVRIPVAWSNMISDDGKYTINDAYLKRVEEVTNYCLNNEMYAIVNIHYDGDWWGQFGDNDQTVRDQAWARFESFWTQIANRYKEYSDRLIFESANEELGDRLNDNWRDAETGEGKYTGTLTVDQCYEVTNAINQKFVEIVRKSGGNNLYRQLLLAGYNTDIDKTVDDRYIMPKDTVVSNGTTKLNVSVHYYTPGGYCIAEDKTVNWYLESWGQEDLEKDIEEMHFYLDKMAKFTDAGYGIIIGEHGPQLMSKPGVIEFLREVMTYCPEHGMAPVIWNTSMYDRENKVLTYSDIAELLAEITGVTDIPVEEGADLTGVVSGEVVDDSNLVKVAEWNGTWTRTNQKTDGKAEDGANGCKVPGEGEVGWFETTNCSEDLTVVSNPFWWQLFVSYNDWASLTKPCIKVTMAEDDISKTASFQLGYGTEQLTYTRADTLDHKEYVEKCIALSPTKFPVKPYVMLSTPTPGATITKVEIYDEKQE